MTYDLASVTPQASKPKRKLPPGLKALAIIVVIMGGLVGAGWVASALLDLVAGSDSNPSQPKSEVRLMGCSTGSDSDYPRATIQATNNSSRTRSFSATVAFFDGRGVQVATGYARIIDLEPGRTGEADAVAFIRRAISTCKLVD